MNTKSKILWVDDEIEILKPHILFLEQKGYELTPVSNGNDALDLLKTEDFDIIFLDENMPGLSGLETLTHIKNIKSGIPVVMITKSEEETIMEEAIGSKIADYLIKPVNPNQILLTLKKNLDDRRLIQEKTTGSYQREFTKLGMEISPNLNFEEWSALYKKLIFWEIELQESGDESMLQILQTQKEEANKVFSKAFLRNYREWLSDKNDPPLLSHNVMQKAVFPLLGKNEKVLVVVIDNLRYDQWKTIQPAIEEHFRVISDKMYCSILPTATQYARNSLFSGLMPTEIQKKFPKLWIEDDDDENSKNQFEPELLDELLKRMGVNIKHNFTKILNLRAGKKYVDTFSNIASNQLNVLVYNFVDMLSHSKTNMEIIKELANDESAYRSITSSWFDHSPLAEVFELAAKNHFKIVLTTDHGSIRVKNPIKIYGDRETNANIRFKYGRNLNTEGKNVFELKNPADLFLPRPNVSTSYMFCISTDYFVYPNNYNYYVNFFADTFQHGGISLEENLIPLITLAPK
ncbi:MAG TPA: PglZ domain-containing protein [Bacteroidales bacterium]|nr:PglZ domain-containing protein [Bacteroidales bacterium]